MGSNSEKTKDGDESSGGGSKSKQDSNKPMLGNEFKATYGDKDLKQKIHATIGSGEIIAEKIDGSLNRDVNAIIEESGHEMRTLKAYYREINGPTPKLEDLPQMIIDRHVEGAKSVYDKVSNFVFGEKAEVSPVPAEKNQFEEEVEGLPWLEREVEGMPWVEHEFSEKVENEFASSTGICEVSPERLQELGAVASGKMSREEFGKAMRARADWRNFEHEFNPQEIAEYEAISYAAYAQGKDGLPTVAGFRAHLGGKRVTDFSSKNPTLSNNIDIIGNGASEIFDAVTPDELPYKLLVALSYVGEDVDYVSADNGAKQVDAQIKEFVRKYIGDKLTSEQMHLIEVLYHFPSIIHYRF